VKDAQLVILSEAKNLLVANKVKQMQMLRGACPERKSRSFVATLLRMTAKGSAWQQDVCFCYVFLGHDA